jgi:hypothetical protein
MRTTVVLVLVALGVGAAPATARSHTINVARHSVSSIGDFRPGSDAHIAAAERAFGPSSSRRATSNSSCDVRWNRLRLKITFANFGAPGVSTCRSDIGLAQSFVVRGKRFRTWHGLRVGQRESSVRRRHSSARLRNGAWWLKSAVSPFGDGETEYAVLSATVKGGRVRALRGWIGAAGE